LALVDQREELQGLGRNDVDKSGDRLVDRAVRDLRDDLDLS
jgi:hypothetical protein